MVSGMSATHTSHIINLSRVRSASLALALRYGTDWQPYLLVSAC